MFVLTLARDCQAPTLPAADAEVVSKVAATLLRITTLFNPFCIAKIVDCDNFNTSNVYS